MDPENDIDNIIDQLKADALPKENSQNKISKESEINNLDDESVGNFVYQKTASLVTAGLDAVNDLRHLMAGGADPKELAAFAQLINAVTKSIDTLNSINLQIKHEKNSIELKQMDIAGKKDIVSKLPAANNILIATRDEVMDKIFDKSRGGRVDVIGD